MFSLSTSVGNLQVEGCENAGGCLNDMMMCFFGSIGDGIPVLMAVRCWRGLTVDHQLVNLQTSKHRGSMIMSYRKETRGSLYGGEQVRETELLLLIWWCPLYTQVDKVQRNPGYMCYKWQLVKEKSRKR